MTKFKDELGRTMLEMLGVLSIMGLIMYGAIAGIGFGLDMYKINATYTEIEELSRGIIDLYSWSRSYAGLTVAEAPNTICQNDLMDCGGNDNAQVLLSKFNGTINIWGTEDGFFIQYVGLPSLACNRLKSMTYSNFPKGPMGNCDSDGNTLTFQYEK